MQVINNPTFGDIHPGYFASLHGRSTRKRTRAEIDAARKAGEARKLHGRARGSHLPSAATHDPWRGRGRSRG